MPRVRGTRTPRTGAAWHKTGGLRVNPRGVPPKVDFWPTCGTKPAAPWRCSKAYLTPVITAPPQSQSHPPNSPQSPGGRPGGGVAVVTLTKSEGKKLGMAFAPSGEFWPEFQTRARARVARKDSSGLGDSEQQRYRVSCTVTCMATANGRHIAQTYTHCQGAVCATSPATS